MKKIWLLAIVLPAFLWSTTSANSNCEDLSFNDADLCISIDQSSSNRFEMSTDISNTNGSVSLLCDVLLPNNNLVNVGACNGEFTYNGNDERTIKVYVRVNQEYKTLEERYDFDNGEWAGGSSSNNNNNNNGDLDNYAVTADDTSPSTSQWVGLTVKARDDSNDVITDFDGSIDYKVYYRSSSSSSWTQTTSSTYYEVNSNYDNGYDFDSSDDGVADLSNFIRFKKNNYDYKVRIFDQDDTSIYKEVTFNVGSSSNNNNNNGDLDNYAVTADDTSPSTNQRVDLTVKARDDSNDVITDFDGSIDYKVYYRSSSSSSWTQTTSSTYYEINSNYENGYDFDSSDDGVADLSNFIEFKKNNYDYKLRIVDQDDSSIYKEITFNVGSSSNNNNNNGDLDNYAVTADDTSPSTSQRVDLTVKARDSDNYTVTDFDGSIDYKVYYRSSSSSSWTQTTSSTYYEVSSSYDNGYDFTSSDDGVADLSNFIRFKKNNYDYKVRIFDQDDTSIYKEITFNVGSNSNNNNSNNGDLDNYAVTADDTSPSTSQRVDLTVKARDNDNYTITDFDGSIEYKVYYRSSSSSSWTQTTSSTYYEINSNYENGYDFDSSDDGVAELSNFIRFKKNNYDYKLRIIDQDDSSIYKEITFNVGSSSNNNNNSNGFTSSERSQVRAIYNLWPNLINELEDQTPALRNNSSWQNDQEDLYSEMRKIVNDDDSIYSDYSEFYDAFMSRYTETLRLT